MSSVAKNFFESFNANALGNGWVNWGAPQSLLSGGQLRITSTTSAAYFGCDSEDFVDLTGSELSIEVVNAGNQGLASLEVYPFDLLLDASNRIMILITNGDIMAYKTVAGTPSVVGTPQTYNSTTHKYVRIREEAGTTYWEYSSDRSQWNVLASQANPIAVTALQPTVIIGTWAAEGSGTTCIFDNLNYIGKERPGNIGVFPRTGNGVSVNGARLC